jgi:hypothetical protein
MIWRPDAYAYAHLRHARLVWPLVRSRYSVNKSSYYFSMHTSIGQHFCHLVC